MKVLDQKKMERIKALLKTHPRGLSITNLASLTHLNRNLIAKYLDMLVISGQVEFQQYGPSKVYFLSQRIPVAAMIEISSDFVMVLDHEEKIVHVNKPFTIFLGIPRENLMGRTFPEIGHPFLSSLPLLRPLETLKSEKGVTEEVRYRDPTGEFFFKVKNAPAVFEDGSVGLTLIIENISVQRRYEENLKLSEMRYRGIVEDQTEFINRLLPDTTITFVNKAFCQFMNSRPEDLLGKRFIEMFPEEDQLKVLKILRSLTPENPTGISEERVMNGWGRMRWVHWTNRAIFNENGTLRELQGIGRDITDVREAAERISRYILQLEFISKKALEFVHSGPGDDLYLSIAKGVKALCPEAGVCVLSYPGRGEDLKVAAVLDEEFRDRIRTIIGKDPVGAWISSKGENIKKMRDGILHRIPEDPFGQCIPSATPEELARLRGSLGNRDNYIMGLTSERDLFGAVLIMLREGVLLQHENLLLTYLNQASMAVQRHVFHENLQRSQEEFRRIIETSAEGIWVLDRDYRTTFVNPRLAEMFGYKPGEMVGEQIEGFMLEQDLPAHRRRVAERRSGMSGRFEQRFRRSDGSLIWVAANATPVMENGEFAGAFAMLTDITEQKMAEDALRESEENYRTLTEASVDGICLVDEEGTIIGSNRAMEEISGIPREEGLGKPLWEVAYLTMDPDRGAPALPEDMRSAILEVLNTGKLIPPLIEREYPIRRLDGTERIIHVRNYLIPHRDRFRMGSLIRDVTDQTLAKEALKESEGRYRALVEQAHDMIIVVQDGVLKFCNPRVAEMWGGTMEEIIGQPYEKFIAPGELPRVRENYLRRMAGDSAPQIYDTILLRRDGSRVPADLSAGTIIYEGRPADLVALRDITEKMEAEEQLKRTQALQQAILSASPVGIGLITNRTLSWCNEAMYHIMGLQPGEWLGLPSRIVFADEGEYERITRELYPAMERQGHASIETVLKRKDGSLVPVLLHVAPIRPGSPDIITVVEDISGMKKAEEELRNTQALQQAILNASPMGIGVTADRHLIWANEAMLGIHGYGRGELEGQPARLLYEDEREYERVTREIRGAMESGQFRELETVWRKKDGSMVEVLLNVGPIRPGSPEILAIARDITHRNMAQRALRESEETFRTMVNINPLPISLIDAKGKYLYVNPAFTQLFGYTLEDIPDGKAWFSLAYPDEEMRRRVIRTWKTDEAEQPKGMVRPRTFQVRCKDGNSRKVHFIPASTPSGLQVVVYHDVTADSLGEGK